VLILAKLPMLVSEALELIWWTKLLPGFCSSMNCRNVPPGWATATSLT